MFGPLSDLSDYFYPEARKAEIEKQFDVAVHTLNFPLINKCIKKGVDPNCIFPDGLTALHVAVEMSSARLILRLILMPQLRIETRTKFGDTPLHLACYNENCIMMKVLLEAGANPNLTNALKQNTLHIATNTGNKIIATLLINSKVNLDAIDGFEHSPLHMAVGSKNYSMVKLLLVRGANPNPVTSGTHLIHETILACRTQHQLEIVELLVKYGININAIDRITDRNSLHFAAIGGCVSLIFNLLKWDCDPDHRDVLGLTPADIAQRHGCALANYLLKNYHHFKNDEYFMNYFSSTSIEFKNPKFSDSNT